MKSQLYVPVQKIGVNPDNSNSLPWHHFRIKINRHRLRHPLIKLLSIQPKWRIRLGRTLKHIQIHFRFTSRQSPCVNSKVFFTSFETLFSGFVKRPTRPTFFMVNQGRHFNFFMIIYSHQRQRIEFIKVRNK